MWRLMIIGLLGVLPANAVAQDGGTGRYQAIPISGGHAAGAGALLLDTRDGHVWRFFGSSSLASALSADRIIYEGKLAPGTRRGEIIPHSSTYLPQPTRSRPEVSARCFTFSGREFCE
jgi:hypothetical protein